MKKNNKGFTLVELIVVLVILAILAAILTPALLGYIDRARAEKDYSTAQTIRVAAQAAIDQAYGDGCKTDGTVPNPFGIDNMDGKFESTNAYTDKTTDTSSLDMSVAANKEKKYKKLVYTLASVDIPADASGTTGVRAFEFKYVDGIIKEGWVHIGSSYYHLTSAGAWEATDTKPTISYT